jgi:hypothetical protein
VKPTGVPYRANELVSAGIYELDMGQGLTNLSNTAECVLARKRYDLWAWWRARLHMCLRCCWW